MINELNWSQPLVVGSGNGRVAMTAFRRIMYSAWNDGDTINFGTLKKVSQEVVRVGTGYYPDITYNGGIHMVWETKVPDDKYGIIYRSPDGETKKISAEPYSEIPQITSLKNDIHVVYISQDNGIATVYYRVSHDNGNRWSDAFVLGNGYTPRIALDANGDAHVVWNLPPPYGVVYRKQRFGEWEAVQPISSGHKEQAPDISINQSGQVMISYTRYVDFDAEFWLDGKIIKRMKDELGFVLWARLDSDCRGRFHVVFQGKKNASDSWNVYHRMWDTKRWSKLKIIAQEASQEQAPVVSVSQKFAGVLYSNGKNILLSRCVIDCEG